ncbi:MAG: ABC transporter ATP-binding protein [Myxococcota bacterium]|nr:ABC transporter ATP-binding protein [Myxococcota bacterium]MDW8361755.1 ATP-binding cassette domain-containing protein [Myxococcales bacterium]
MTDVMIEARELTKRYGSVTALSKVSFDVRRGEVLGFLGPNGAGKTTTMKILTCFIAPTEGTARVAGCDVFDDPMGVRRALGYLPEHNPLYPDMLVLEYLRWVADVRGLKGEEASRKIRKAVEATRLGEVVSRQIRELSKGFRQRVGLAQALLHEPPILILDEPMSGLDPNQAVEIRDLIREIGRERTVILSTHNLAEVQVACSRVLIIARGRIVADDTPEALRARGGRARYRVTVAASNGKREAAREAFGRIEGVDAVRPLDGADAREVSFEIEPSSDRDLRAELFRAAVDAGLVLLELRREGQNLEGIFRELTLGGDAQSQATARPEGGAGPARRAASEAPPTEGSADEPQAPTRDAAADGKG